MVLGTDLVDGYLALRHPQTARESGAGYTALVAMSVGYGVIGAGRIPFGLVIFSPSIVALRLAPRSAALNI